VSTAQRRLQLRGVTELLRLLRPHQWIKNAFVLVGVLFAHQWSNPQTLTSVAVLFAAFCAMASAVYVYNDIRDVEEDRLHPRKHKRPIASGAIALPHAGAIVGVLAALGLMLGWACSPLGAVFVGAYALLNVAYTHWIKRVVILDVFAIALGFMLRLLAGTLGVGIEPSQWLLLCGFMITLFLGFAKRRAELGPDDGASPSTRQVLRNYRRDVLDQLLAVTAACTVLSYALYTVNPETIALHGTPRLIWTVPFIVYGIFRYMVLLHAPGKGQDTAGDLLGDRHLIITVLCWAALTAWLIA
jgi:4-hydroxybenzoate polyprenyltransferase